VLSDAVEELYRAFRDVPLDSDVSYCDHCLGPEDVEELRVTPLRSLGTEAIHRVLYNPGTLGDITYYRHFLPRALELATTGGDIWPTDLNGLRPALGESGPAQRAAVLAFLRTWWDDTLSRWPSPTRAEDVLDLADDCDPPLRAYLDVWAAHGTPAAAHHLADHLRYLVSGPSTAEIDAWLASGDASALIRGVPPHPDFDHALRLLDYLEHEGKSPADPLRFGRSPETFIDAGRCPPATAHVAD
jgi:hypothetical protein